MLAIILSLLFLLFCLAVIGEPLRIAISRFSKLFTGIDVLQILTIDVFLGGMIIYALALMPLRLVNPIVMIATLLLSALFVLGFYLRRFLRKELRSPNRNDIYCYVIVLVVLLSTLLIEVVPTTNFMFGSVHDTSLSALFTEVMLENQQIPVTQQPYLPEGIIYPQAFFTVAAYAHILLNLSVAEIPLRITPLFQALAVLGAYYLGKVLLNRKLGVSFAFIFGFVSQWPKLVTWGSNAFVFGFALCLISLSLISNLKYSPTQNTATADLLIIGILYGYLAAIHLQLYIFVFASMLVAMLASVLRYGRESIRQEFRNLVTVILVSIVPVSLFVFRALVWFPYPGHNIGLPSDIAIPAYTVDYSKIMTIFTEAVGQNQPITIEFYLLSGIGILTLAWYYGRKKLGPITRAVGLSGASLIGCLAVFFISLVQYTFPGFGVFIGEPARYLILLEIPVFFFLGIFFVLFYDHLQSHLRKQTKPLKSHIKNIRRSLPVLLVFSAITIPFLCYSIVYDYQFLTRNYNVYAVTKQDDLAVMQWMKGNLPANASILINPDDAGGFIPAVSNLKVIYPFTASRTSKTYVTLVELINENTFNSTTYDLMKRLNVTHIFVGSSAIMGRHTWNASRMLEEPDLELAENVSACYLFRVVY